MRQRVIIPLLTMLLLAAWSCSARQSGPDSIGQVDTLGLDELPDHSRESDTFVPAAGDAQMKVRPDSPFVVVRPQGDRDLGEGADDEPLGCYTMVDETPHPIYRRARTIDQPYRFTRYHDSSTFGCDVDTASYGLVTAALQSGRWPEADQVRIEELINSFRYDYRRPVAGEAFAIDTELGACPWQRGHLLLRIGIQAAETQSLPPCNLVFLVDVSGSMRGNQRIGLVKEAFALLVDQLDEGDRVAIVSYGSRAEVVLDPTPGNQHSRIFKAMYDLRCSGSTAGEAGIRTAYTMARQLAGPGSQTRVIIASDGDFNIGTRNDSRLVDIIRDGRNRGIYLNLLGVGQGNVDDARLERLSADGNGSYAFISSQAEAETYFRRDLLANMITVADDAKVQIFFNPERVQAWRQVGYANRQLAKGDFNNDAVDAGEVGSGAQVTALYEIIPTGTTMPDGDPSPFTDAPAAAGPSDMAEMLCRVRLRYKPSGEERSRLIEQDVSATAQPRLGADSRWAATMASFGMLLRHSPYRGEADWKALMPFAQSAKGEDPDEQRWQAVQLMHTAARKAGY